MSKNDTFDFDKELKLGNLFDAMFHKLIEDLSEKYASFSLEYDSDYGVDKKTGWTVKIEGTVIVEFCASPDLAVYTAYFKLKEFGL